MENISFLEELENRLNQLEKEINKSSRYKVGNLHMENMIHIFDSAMDNITDSTVKGSDMEIMES